MEYRYYECRKCGAIIKMSKPDIKKYVSPSWESPSECYEDQGGCGRITKFRELKPEWVKQNKPNSY